jgi:hypothetical protein
MVRVNHVIQKDALIVQKFEQLESEVENLNKFIYTNPSTLAQHSMQTQSPSNFDGKPSPSLKTPQVRLSFSLFNPPGSPRKRNSLAMAIEEPNFVPNSAQKAVAGILSF